MDWGSAYFEAPAPIRSMIDRMLALRPVSEYESSQVHEYMRAMGALDSWFSELRRIGAATITWSPDADRAMVEYAAAHGGEAVSMAELRDRASMSTLLGDMGDRAAGLLRSVTGAVGTVLPSFSRWLVLLIAAGVAGLLLVLAVRR